MCLLGYMEEPMKRIILSLKTSDGNIHNFVRCLHEVHTNVAISQQGESNIANDATIIVANVSNITTERFFLVYIFLDESTGNWLTIQTFTWWCWQGVPSRDKQRRREGTKETSRGTPSLGTLGHLFAHSASLGQCAHTGQLTNAPNCHTRDRCLRFGKYCNPTRYCSVVKL